MIGNTLSDLGQIHYQLGRLDDAYRCLEEARALRERTGQTGSLWNTLTFLGLTLAAMDRPDSAAACYRQALALTTAQANDARTLIVLTNYAKLLVDAGDPSALQVSERALGIARSLGDNATESVLESNLGDDCRRRGRFTDALRHYATAIALCEHDPPNLSARLNALGRTLLQLGEPERARRPVELALAMADSLGDPRLRAISRNNLSSIVLAQGERAAANRLGLEALGIAVAAGDSERVRDACEALSYPALAAGDLAAADHWRTRAVAASERLGPERRARDIISLALVWTLKGRLDDAERGYRRALDLARQSGFNEGVLDAMIDLADVAERRGNSAEALARYGMALAMIDTMRSAQQGEETSIKVLASRFDPYEAMIHLLARLDPRSPDSGYAARAFEWSERARARAFLDAAAAAGARPRGEPTLTLDQVRRGLRSSHEALLEYSVGDSGTSLWVIRRDRWKHFMLPARAALRVRIATLRQGLANPGTADASEIHATERELYRVLIAPAETELAGVDQLVIAADGVLSLIPFEVLLARDAPGERAPPGAYLVERYTISYAPSASALAIRAVAAGGPRIVAVGDPAFGHAPLQGADPAAMAANVALEALPYTAAELATLAHLAGRRPYLALSGSAATRERLLRLAELPSAGVIHLATHGDVNATEPDRSGLWLAPDSGSAQPSRLEVRDIVKLRLTAGLVVLSACETGMGRLERGEGVIGLARAFLLAGAQCTLVSLWKVNDRSTSLLMERFYRRALDGRTSRAQALAEAKRALLRTEATHSPFFWAPFILIGQAGSNP